ncbi:ribosome biogenesis GTPase A [Pseudobutyrivibrio sp. 49]|uniref:ribosome biogenesis GTPase YlqF n=1 Tax=unclassified Pseudobutyrivibrio TaxID=2638619 RepID=UPI000889A751|nr:MULTISPECIES: ribosome biogenesis GTPase YlqF [unclassified Pseudobutyrivibrio]SDH40429.1 ribosome biogenesis GTPase A [Pseudobutyrivibrio sp. 49]SFN45867.1 ribosome biogenesis GTPase A [Pseudobutyrivibrio sp. UC1225]
MEFQWYPGHMTKAKRQMQEDIKLIDLVIEVIDARCPVSSRNPDINGLANGKLRLILLNKSDLADKSVNQKWKEYFKAQGFYCVELDSRDRKNMKGVQATLDEVCAAKFERDRKRGIKNRPVRAMVVGIPNVGKSTFINSFAGRAVAKTGNKPGVTKGKQWIKLNKSVELLDTPGILWPKFEDNTVGLHLAFIGSINDAIIETRELSLELADFLKENYPGILNKRYEINEDAVNHEIISEIAAKRNFVKKGSELDFDKAAAVLIDEFRNGSLGNISLERP